MPDDVDEWAALDEVLGVESIDLPENSVGPLAFYGRCSTEDNQDPETSLGWQLGNASKFVEPLGGVVVAEYFDVGQSRSVPWDRRDDARRLLSDLKDPNRGWDAVVVGEGTRCWFGNQFSLVAPRFANYGVQLWIPELGGRFDSKNPSHKMLMSVLGGMSESERQHIQARVRAAMDAQVLNEGRHLRAAEHLSVTWSSTVGAIRIRESPPRGIDYGYSQSMRTQQMSCVGSSPITSTAKAIGRSPKG